MRSQICTRSLKIKPPSQHIMASEPVLQKFFKSEQYADSFKRGELVTYVFAKSLVEQSKLITTSKIHPNAPLAVLDNACGTGAVSSILNETLDVETKKHWKLTCGDISSAVLKYTERRMQDENWQNSETKLVDAQSPQLPSAFYDYVFTAFGKSLSLSPIHFVESDLLSFVCSLHGTSSINQRSRR